MNSKIHSAEAEIGGKSWQWSTGLLAPQADGAVTVRVGDTVVLATVVMSDTPRDGIDFLPLMVDYEEKLYAAGKIKGSRWIKREGRPSDDAVLKGRVIDRTIRPMFDGRIRNDIQVITTVLSADGKNDPDMVALNAAVAAIEVSDIPWDGPIAGVRVGKIDGELVVNPSFEQMESNGELDLIVSGTEDHIVMVEAGAKEVTEEEILRAIELAQAEIKKIVKAVKELATQVAKEKRTVTIFEPDPEVVQKAKTYEQEFEKALFESTDKDVREHALSMLKEKMKEEIAGDDDTRVPHVSYMFEKMLKELMQQKILQDEKRIDGRKLDEIRTITSQVGLLPRVHGSGLFQRGETQVLTTVTLGGPGEEQLLEDLETEEERKKRYMHHYNFPPYSVGETRPMRSPGRREIGHGALAERALKPVIPSKEEFPYTLRLVSEVLSSNGSTSMASTCGSTLALMDAGVKIKAPISGIAMGLVLDVESGAYKVLSDIQGVEDMGGHMDFKVAGSKDGVTALQLDIKVKGLTIDILKDALAVAKNGRMYILDKMLETITETRAQMSPYAPRVISFKIDPEKIRDVIGPGGKIINEIIDQTGVNIDIEDDGTVMITSSNEAASEKAVEWVKNITREVKPGEQFEGVVKRIMDFGAFVEILPGQQGMVHVSELAPHRVEKVTDEVQIGDTVKVVVKEIDELGRINLSRKALMSNGDKNEKDRNDKGNRNHEKPRGNKRYIAKK